MTEQQFQALMEYIDARIDEKIQDALGRDALNEAVAQGYARELLRRAFYLDID